MEYDKRFAPKSVRDIARQRGDNTITYIGEHQGSSIWNTSFVDEDGVTFPTGLPNLILLKNNELKFVGGEEALELLRTLKP